MEEMYGLNSTTTTADIYSDGALMTPENLMMLPSDYCYDASPGGGDYFRHPSMMMFGSSSTDEMLSAAASSEPAAAAAEHEDLSSAIKDKIASHPRYPRLLQAYIDCQKVGAPPEMASILDEMMRENDVCPQDTVISACSGGADPELDDFMETYCDMLVKYKTDLARPFDEATTFLNKIEMQLVHLCKGVSISSRSDDGGVSSEEEVSGGETETQDYQPTGDEGRDLKDRLLRKFGGHISSLKIELSKKKKTGKLPREARQILLDWWNSHYKWPYPTEADKIALAESTSLDQKQINNWFINQRKRHWKPSESMQFGTMDSLSGQLFSDD